LALSSQFLLSTRETRLALERRMSIEDVIEGLMSFAEDDWVPLWVICCDVEDELGAEDPETNLQLTLVVVRELLKRGLIAGDSFVHGVHFNAWPVQDPEVIADFIRREWSSRGGFPEWDDGPWFAHLRRCSTGHAAA
jgi:hypothetical protein